MVRSCMRVFVEVMVASIVCPILWVGPDTCCSKKESRRRLMVEVSEKSILSRCILRSPRIYIYRVGEYGQVRQELGEFSEKSRCCFLFSS